MPDFSMPSAIARIRSSLTLQANLFQLFQPMGGVSARLADGEEFCEETWVHAMSERKMTAKGRVGFMTGSREVTCDFVPERCGREKVARECDCRAAHDSAPIA